MISRGRCPGGGKCPVACPAVAAFWTSTPPVIEMERITAPASVAEAASHRSAAAVVTARLIQVSNRPATLARL